MPDTNPHPRISADPAIMVGKPCNMGTRITVEIVLKYLAKALTSGDSFSSKKHRRREHC